MDNITQSNTLDMSSDKDITLTSYSEDNTVNTIKKDKTFTELATGTTITSEDVPSSCLSYMLCVSKGSLTTNNITLDGQSTEHYGGGILNKSGTNVDLNDGTTIKNFISNDSNGAGLRLNDSTSSDNIATAMIDGATLTNNKVPENRAGAIFVSKYNKLNIKKGIITNNSAHGGGAIENEPNATVVLDNGTVSENYSSYRGGAIYNHGNIIINNVSVLNNSSNESGGAIFNDASGNLEIHGGKISNNTAGKTSSSGADAGAILNTGVLKITDGLITNNRAYDYKNERGLGGAIQGKCFTSHCSEITITGGTITNNTADRYGGAISYYSGTTSDYNKMKLIINGGNISDNTAQIGGGISGEGQIKINGGTINNNTATNTNSQLLYANIRIATDSNNSNITDSKANFTSKNLTNYKIVSITNNNYVLDVTDGKIANGTNIQLYQSVNANKQKWKFFPSKVINGTVYYRFQSQIDGTQYIGVAGDSSTSGANVHTWSINNLTGEQWQLQDAGSGYYYFKNIGGLCLDLYGGSVANGTNIQGYTCNQTAAQKWKPIAS